MKNIRGFTLIELVLVIIIIAILATVVAMLYPGKDALNQASIADQLKTDIRLTQTQAMSLGSNVSITINAGSYQISGGGSLVTLPTGVTLSPVQTITFDKTGTPTTGTTITITVGASTRTLTVNATTGYVNG